MDKEQEAALKDGLISQVVSRISLSETINVVHALAKSEIEDKIKEMSDEEKEATYKELFEKQV